MARSSSIHYIAPSSISIVPNANGSASDLAVFVARGTAVRVYEPRIAGLGMEGDTYRQWTLSGRNRRLAEDGEYRIYARLSKADGTAYLVFSKNDYVLTPNVSKTPIRAKGDDGKYYDWPALSDEQYQKRGYWWVSLGTVSASEGGVRTVSLDTGILGTDRYNEEYSLSPDAMPLRVELGCTVDDEDAGPTPYVPLGKSAVLTAVLLEGWSSTSVERFDHWEITRYTEDAIADDAWNRPEGEGSHRGMDGGSVRLVHSREAGADDFNGAVAAVFTVSAWGRPDGSPEPSGGQETDDTPDVEDAPVDAGDGGEGGQEGGGGEQEGEGQDVPELVVLASASITMYPETSERFEIVPSTGVVSYNSSSDEYIPADGVTVRVRATDQRGDASDLTYGQFSSMGLSLEYASEEGAWTQMSVGGATSAVVTAVVPTEAFSEKRGVSVRLVRNDPDGGYARELARTVIDFVQDATDTKEREWIFLRSKTDILFGDVGSAFPEPYLILKGEKSPEGEASDEVDYDDQLDGWVPQGWWDEEQGVSDTWCYEYASYRDYVSEEDGGHWGPFTKARIWHHFAGLISGDEISDVIDEQVGGKYISKQVNDAAAGVITFLKGIKIGLQRLFGWDAEGNITANDVNVGGLLTSMRAKIDELFSSNYSGSGIFESGWLLTNNHNGHSYLEIDELLVRMKAVFMELEIRKETYSGGNVFYSPAGSIIYRVECYDVNNNRLGIRQTEVVRPFTAGGRMLALLSAKTGLFSHKELVTENVPIDHSQVAYYRCYLVADDGTVQTRNWWHVGDQARCQTFNRASNKHATDTSDAVNATINEQNDYIQDADHMDGNRFFWRLVMRTGSTRLEDGKWYDYVDLSNDASSGKVAGSDYPMPSDSIVCIGNRSDSERMNMIMLEVIGDDAPAIKIYKGINSFSFAGRKYMSVSPKKVQIRANSIEYITDNGLELPPKVNFGEWAAGNRYHYYEEVSHDGCLWLCVIEDGYRWERSDGTVVSTPSESAQHAGEGLFTYGTDSQGKVLSDRYYATAEVNNNTVYKVRNYTTAEPTENESDWQMEVSAGGQGIPGTSPWVADLDNEMDSISVDKKGVIVASQEVSTVVTLYHGNAESAFVTPPSVWRNGVQMHVNMSSATEMTYDDGVAAIWNTSQRRISFYYDATITKTYTEGGNEYTETAAVIEGKDEYEIKVTSTEDSRIQRSVFFTVNGVVGDIYNLLPKDKEIVATTDVNGNLNVNGSATVAPICGYTKRVDGVVTETVESVTDGQINNEKAIFYRLRNRSTGQWDVWSQDPTKGMWSRFESGTTNFNVNTYDAIELIIVPFHSWRDGYVSDKPDTIDREVVYVVSNGREGNSIRTVSIYKWSADAPQKPTSTDIPPTGWMTVDSGTHADNALLWMCWGTTVNGVLDSNGWSGPVQMSGKDGKAGEDGEIVEYIYKQTNTYNGYGTHPKDITTPAEGSAGQSPLDDDFVPLGWTDNAQGVSTSMKYEYCSMREKQNGTWGNFSDPFPWAVYGDKGQDGDGVEYVYFRTKGAGYIPTITTQGGQGQPSDDEYLPGQGHDGENYDGLRWTDDPKGVDSTWQVEWVTVRKKRNGTWGNFSTPAIWAKYGNDGANGADGANSVRIDLDNQTDMVSVDSNGKVRFARTVIVRARIYDGAAAATSGVTNTTTDSLVIGGCTPTTSLSGGILTVTWNFTKGMSAATASKTIKLTYGGNEYSAVFSLATTNYSAVYQCAPSPSAVSYAWDDANSYYTPVNGIDVYFGYTKDGGSGVTYVAQPSSDTIDGTYHIARRSFNNGSWQPWRFASSAHTTNTGTATSIEMCITTASNEADISDANIIDREVIPIVRSGKDGETALVADLTNEMDSVAMTTGGAVTTQTTLTTTFSMYYGKSKQELTSLTPSGQASGVTVFCNTSSGLVTITVAANTSLANDKNVITLTGICAKGTKSCQFTIAGVRAGSNGQPATMFNIIPSTDVIKRNKDNTLSPVSPLIVSVQKLTGSNVATATSSDGTLRYNVDGDIANSSQGTAMTIGGTVAYTNANSYITLAFFVGNTLHDKERVPIVFDGEDGVDGTNGISLESHSTMWAQNNSGTTAPTTGWGSERLYPTGNAPYVWRKEIWTYTAPDRGRNIMRGTADLKPGSGTWTSGTVRKSGSGTFAAVEDSTRPIKQTDTVLEITADSGGGMGFAQDYVNLEAGSITMSCWVKGDAGTTFFLQAFWSSGHQSGQKGFTCDGTWQKVVQTATANTAQYSIGYVYVTSANKSIRICGIKVERGEAPTDWTMAPEDLNREEVCVWSVLGQKGDFKSRAFARTNTNIASESYRPTGGTYDNPHPTGTQPGGISWSDGVPFGTARLWSSVCTFHGDGTQGQWSIPSPESDTADLDLEFSLSESETAPLAPSGNTPRSDHSSEGWYDPSLNQTLPSEKTWSDMIWRAERKIKNGVYDGEWVITRIKGEKGDPAEIDEQTIQDIADRAAAELDDGVSIQVNPQAIFVNQDTAGEVTFGSRYYAEVSVFKSDAAISFSLSDSSAWGQASNGTFYKMGTEGNNSYTNVDGGATANTKKVYLTGITVTPNQSTSEYEYSYDHGYIVFRVNFGSGNDAKHHDMKVAWYLNRLGNRDTKIRGDISTTYMSRTEYALAEQTDNLLLNTKSPQQSSDGSSGTWQVESGTSLTTITDSPVDGYNKAFHIGSTSYYISQPHDFWKKTDTYKFGAYARCVSSTASATAHAQVRVLESSSVRFNRTVVVGTSWTYISFTVDIPQYNEATGVAKFQLGSNSGTVEFIAPILTLVNNTSVIRTDYEGQIQTSASGLDTKFTSITNDLDGKIATNASNISTLSQTASGLTSRVASVEGDITTLDGDLDDLEGIVSAQGGSISTIQQTSDRIHMGITTGWKKNYVVNPLATDGRVNTADSSATKNDNEFGQVVELANNGGNWQLNSVIDSSYNELTGKTVTWFCIVKAVERRNVSPYNCKLHFGTGANETIGNLHAIVMTATYTSATTPMTIEAVSNLNTSDYKDISYGQQKIGENGWYICWVSATPRNSSTTIIDGGSIYDCGFNSMEGKWQIYYGGVVLGNECPSVDVIRESGNLKRTGIDIEKGKVDVRADNFTVRNNNDEQTLGVDANGDFEVSGTIKANNLYRSLCILSGYYNTISERTVVYYSTEWYYCKSREDDRTIEGGYEIGKYYEDNISRGLWSNSDFSRNTYSADIVLITNNGAADWPSGGIVMIPRAQDFPGKVIEFRNYGNNSATIQIVSGYFVTFHLDNQGNIVVSGYTSNSQTLVAGATMTLYSFKNGNTYYWMRIS